MVAIDRSMPGQVDRLDYVLGNAEALPLPDACMDRVIIGFGLRNVTRKAMALGEMHRVLRPGGRVLILEFSQVKAAAARAIL